MPSNTPAEWQALAVVCPWKGEANPEIPFSPSGDDCPEEVFQSGVPDDFDTSNGAELAEPSEGLKKAINYGSGYPSSWRGYDTTVSNRWFGHTFTNLKANGLEICGATLEIKVRSENELFYNDRIGIQFTYEDGSRAEQAWSHTLIELGDSSQSTKVISLDLSDLPQSEYEEHTHNLISALNSHGFLDINVQDDTGVDYVKLNIEYCCNSQVDVWVADPHPDNGEEPNTVSSNIWSSPDVWVRNENDGGTSYQNVKHGQDNYVYVRAKNRGSSTASNTKVEVYRNKASLGSTWPVGWELVGESSIDSLEPEASEIVHIKWDTPG
jgi:hypothetical protein